MSSSDEPATPEPRKVGGEPNERQSAAPPRHGTDRKPPILGEMSEVVRGIIVRARLSWLVDHYARLPVLALFSFVNGCISIGIMAALAVITHNPFVFPSLGPTAFLFFYT